MLERPRIGHPQDAPINFRKTQKSFVLRCSRGRRPGAWLNADRTGLTAAGYIETAGITSMPSGVCLRFRRSGDFFESCG
jgi:hypothetical protein